MKFLADEDFPKPLVTKIQKLGFSIKTIQQTKLQGSSDETINWKTYTNLAWNFSFKYPPDKEFFEAPPPNPGLTLWIDDQIMIEAKKSDPKKSTESLLNSPYSNIVRTETIKVGGIEAQKIIAVPKDRKDIVSKGENTGLICLMNYQTVLVRHKNVDYQMSVQEVKNADTGKCADANYKAGEIPDSALKLFDQILSTFKFTN